jgi:hypothetical protein
MRSWRYVETQGLFYVQKTDSEMKKLQNKLYIFVFTISGVLTYVLNDLIAVDIIDHYWPSAVKQSNQTLIRQPALHTVAPRKTRQNRNLCELITLSKIQLRFE